MTPHPDKLFQDRLEHYQKVAPASAWDRIESGLDRKRRRSPWMKIAAGFLMMIVTSVVIVHLNKTDTPIATAYGESATINKEMDSTIAVTEIQEVVKKIESLPSNSMVERSRNNYSDVLEEDLSVVERTSAEQSRSSQNEPAMNSRQSSVLSPQLAVGSPQSTVSSPQSAVHSPQSTVSKSEELITAATAQQSDTNKESTQDVQAEITNQISTPDATSDWKGSSITYSADEVNAKFLKKESATEATSEKKNTSGFQKVIDLALDIKSEVPVIGELREKKNELLSFNMPSNKRELNK